MKHSKKKDEKIDMVTSPGVSTAQSTPPPPNQKVRKVIRRLNTVSIAVGFDQDKLE